MEEQRRQSQNTAQMGQIHAAFSNGPPRAQDARTNHWFNTWSRGLSQEEMPRTQSLDRPRAATANVADSLGLTSTPV